MAILQQIGNNAKKENNKRIYLVSPVRNLTEDIKIKLLAYTEKLEKEGCIVKLPFRDTNQIDEIGLRITKEHIEDIIWADEIHIWLRIENDKIASEGSLFDCAQALIAKKFMPDKKIIIANIDEIEATKDKSYINVLLATHFRLRPENTLEDLKKCLNFQKFLKKGR